MRGISLGQYFVTSSAVGDLVFSLTVEILHAHNKAGLSLRVVNRNTAVVPEYA